MDKKYCIFDMDGTLVDSMSYWQGMEREYLARRGAKPGPELEELIERLRPMTLKDAARVFISELGISDTPEQISAEMNAVMEENYRLRIPLKPDVAEYLTLLRERGAKLCTASATITPLVKMTLDRLGVGHLFDFMLSCVDVGASKDRPDVYFAAAARLGAKPEETAVFEDSLQALTTAKKAGFYAVAVRDESSVPDWPALRELADESVESWAQAAEALRGE